MQPELAAAALRRGGVFTHADAGRAGYTAAEIRVRLRRGRWVALRCGIYAVAPVSDDDRRVQAAALAALPATAALSHRSAARMHGLPLIGTSRAGVDATVPGAVDRIRRGLAVHGRSLGPDSVVLIGGLRVTDAARTALDLARSLAFPEAVVVVEAALWTFSGLGPTLVASAQAAVGPRSAKARRVIEFSGNSSESPGESLSRVALASHGLPAPQQQAWISDDAGTIGRVDFLWPAERTVGEFDGRSKYERVEDLWAEKRREDRLRSQGYEVVRWIWRDVVGDFGPTAHRIRSAFARAVGRSVSLPLTS